MELINELGWINEFLQLPHTKMTQVTVDVAGIPITFADFRMLNVCPYVAFMPQWDFPNFLVAKARVYPGFRILMNAEVTELDSWDDVHFLRVSVDRLRRWSRPGLLCIGDAAHAMSPAGGVGINLAVQDAVATANILGPSLGRGKSSAVHTLTRVQRRRALRHDVA